MIFLIIFNDTEYFSLSFCKLYIVINIFNYLKFFKIFFLVSLYLLLET